MFQLTGIDWIILKWIDVIMQCWQHSDAVWIVRWLGLISILATLNLSGCLSAYEKEAHCCNLVKQAMPGPNEF